MTDFSIHIEPYIVGHYYVSDLFSIVMFSNHSPKAGEVYLINQEPYKVISVNDITDDEEFEMGLSYDEVVFELVEE